MRIMSNVNSVRLNVIVYIGFLPIAGAECHAQWHGSIGQCAEVIGGNPV